MNKYKESLQKIVEVTLAQSTANKIATEALQSESERIYEIEFDRGLKTVIQVTDSDIKIISAVDGWGDNIEDEFITIQSIPKTPKI
jgi:hypothetical protein